MRRTVTLLHRFGGMKEGLTGLLAIEGSKNLASKVYVDWPLNEQLVFVAATGRMHKRPRGTWRLSEEDVNAFCEAAKIPPQYKKPLRPLSGPRKPVDRDSPADRKFRARQQTIPGTQ
jgi:hypothetical protein